ncbi:MAG: biotin/lipoyl-containing protein, partial [Shewanella sp.]
AELKAQMGQAAVAAAKAINYVGAGTVEFLLGSDNRFYFMEMNTRLQVEHPVTEMITAQDLVHWQLLVASGQPLPLTQEQVQIRGHAFEARIYAEDPHNHFLPASGKLEFLREPKLSPNVRIDSGVREHDVISNFYDPMIAKLIVWDESRPRALQRLAHALESYHIAGLKHNVEFLTKIATHPEFAAANFSTDFIERFGDDLLTQVEDDNHHAQALACAALYQVLARKQAQTLNKTATDPHSPWNIGNGFRINSHGVHTIVLLDDANHLQQLRVIEQQDGYLLVIQDKVYELTGTLSGQHLLAEINGHKMQLAFSQAGDDFTLFLATGSHHFKAVQRQVHEQKINAEDKLKAPMNGTIAAHLVAAGDTVVAGQGLLVMEAMKMEYTITAPFDGTISAFFYAKGELVKDGSLLAELRPADLVQSAELTPAELTLTEPASAKAQEA